MSAKSETVTLERSAFPTVALVSVESMENSKLLARDVGWGAPLHWLEPTRSATQDGYELRLRQDVLVSPNESVTVHYPEDWWQAFKARWFPRWMLRRWPAKWVRISIDKYAVYPEFKPPKAKFLKLDVIEHRYEQDGVEDE